MLCRVQEPQNLTPPLDLVFLVMIPYKDRFFSASQRHMELTHTELLKHIDCCKNSPNQDSRIKAPFLFSPLGDRKNDQIFQQRNN